MWCEFGFWWCEERGMVVPPSYSHWLVLDLYRCLRERWFFRVLCVFAQDLIGFITTVRNSLLAISTQIACENRPKSPKMISVAGTTPINDFLLVAGPSQANFPFCLLLIACTLDQIRHTSPQTHFVMSLAEKEFHGDV